MTPFTTVHFGRPSFTIGNSGVQVFVSIQGGHCTASFTSGRTSFSPYFVAPWWRDAPFVELDPVLQGLRGDFFCLPFGANPDPVGGVRYPIHGRTANECWNFVRVSETPEAKDLVLSMDLTPDKGTVRKEITLREREPVIYTRDVVEGFGGRAPIGHHPNIQCADGTATAIIDISPFVTGFTAPVPLGTPENKGYSMLQPGAEFKDLRKAPTQFGGTVDLSSYPIPRGYEDGVLLINDPSNDFVFTALTEREKGFLYFHLKDPKVLAETLLWMPLGGNFTPPFNGRVNSVIGLEEVTGNFFYGRKASIEANMISNRGYPTFREFSESTPAEIKLIAGAVPVDKSFKGVSDIIRKTDSEIRIVGRGGERIDVPCRTDFLK